jgi:hypothetical protein
MKIVRPPGLVYDGETPEQAAEIDRLIAEHNAAVQKQYDAWRPKPAAFYRKWVSRFAPHLLDKP